MRFLPSLFVAVSIFTLSARTRADDAGRPPCSTPVAPAPGESIPLNAPALAIEATGASDVELTGADGLLVFVNGPQHDPVGLNTVLVTPIGAAAGRHDLAFTSACATAEHHDVTFGPEVPYPAAIGRVVRTDERARMVNIEIELSPEAAAYAPIASFTPRIGGGPVPPTSWYGQLPPYFARSGRTVTAAVPAAIFDHYCRGGSTTSISIGLAMHVAGAPDDPPPLEDTLVHSCLIDGEGAGEGAMNGSYGSSGPCSYRGGRTCPDGGDPAPVGVFDQGDDTGYPKSCACDVVGARDAARTPFAFAAALFAVAAGRAWSRAKAARALRPRTRPSRGSR